MRLAFGLALAVAAAALQAGGALAQEVGKASAVNPAATANMRTISIGASIAHKERIKTESAGSVQILFVDKTSMTVGPNSDVTIDEYVYNPSAGTGKLAATLGKGALRFVGGQISHTGNAEIKTASAVIGIRGGVALITRDSVFAGYGSLSVSSPQGAVTLAAGEYTRVAGDMPPLPPAAPPAGFVANLVKTFQSAPGQSGGVSKGTASPAAVARAEQRATGSATASVAGSLTPQPAPVQTAAPAPNLTQTIQTVTQNTAVERAVEGQRPTAALQGFHGGMVTSSAGSQTGAASPVLGVTTLTLNGVNGRVQGNLIGVVAENSTGQYTPQNYSLQYGFQEESEEPQSQYLNYNNFGANAAVRRNGEAVSKVDGLSIRNHSGMMTTLTEEQARQATNNSSLNTCVCDYTRWGAWTSESQQPVGSVVYMDRFAGFWVAGRPSQAQDVPATGTATYSGHVAAMINNNGQTYAASGNMTNTVNFGSRTGTVQVIGLDNTNYAGTLQVSGNAIGGLATGGNRVMALAGMLMQGRNSPVGEMGGLVAISGQNYMGSGIFAAKMR